MAAAITDRTRAIIVCSPNNPTGPIVTAGEFDDVHRRRAADVLVILDEAYAEFVTDPESPSTALDVLGADGRTNVVVLRTFSKAYGLAGLRVGYAIGTARILDAARSTSIPLSVTAHGRRGRAGQPRPAEAELLERVARSSPSAATASGGGARGPADGASPRPRATSSGSPPGRETLDGRRRIRRRTGSSSRPFAGDGMRISSARRSLSRRSYGSRHPL